jgi:hypothetical protein
MKTKFSSSNKNNNMASIVKKQFSSFLKKKDGKIITTKKSDEKQQPTPTEIKLLWGLIIIKTPMKFWQTLVLLIICALIVWCLANQINSSDKIIMKKIFNYKSSIKNPFTPP